MKRRLLISTSLLLSVCFSMNAQETSGSCGENATWTYESTTLTVSGTGEMYDYAYGETPWNAYAETMTSLVIEDGITSIGNNAFAGFEKLNSVQYPASGFTSIGDYAFSGAKVKYPNLPNTLTHLGDGAFASSQAKGVSIPASLKKISDFAFESCANLESVGIYEGVEEIGESAFDGCAFTVITIPGTVKTIGGGAFMSNTELESVYISAGVKTIGDAAFQGCTGLKKVGIGGNSKPTLGDAVFTDYDGTTPLGIEAFYVPYGVDYDGWGGFDSEKFKTAFYGTWTYSDFGTPDAEKGSGNWSFDILEGRLTVTGTGQLNVAPWNDEPAINPIVYQDYEHPGFWGGIKSAAFGNGITSLENMACGMQINCASVTLPNTLKTITNSALEECAFTSIDLPEGLETIDMYAFFGSKLTALTIPSTVTYLGASSFSYNEDLAVVTMLPATPPTLYTDELPFGGCEKLTAIYVKEGLAGTYKTADGWSTYAEKIFDAPNTTFTYTATEKVAKFDDNLDRFQGAISVKSHEFDGTNGTVVYEGYVTGLGELAVSYAKMTSITIPESVTSIGSGAFQSSKLASVTFAGTTALKTIGARAFSSCTELTTFTVPATVESIGTRAFSGCSKLETFTFDGTPIITSIGNAAFSDCDKLTDFTIPESVTTLGQTVFWYTGLTSLNIPAGVTSIGQALFCASPVTSLTIDAANPKYADLGCNGIFEKAANKLIAGGAVTTIPDGITTIGEEAFWGEEGTFALTLPESVTTIESRAFHMTSGLTSVNIPSGVTHIDAETFFFCEMQDVYCYASPTITWDGGMKEDFSLMNPNSTKFHVADADAWVAAFPDANVTFEGNLNNYAILADGIDNSTTLTNIDGNTYNVVFNRRFPAGKKQTICLPFDPSPILSLGTVWSFDHTDALRVYMVEQTGSLSANTPYIFEPSDQVTSITFNGAAVTVDADPKTTGSVFTFKGTYSQMHWLSSDPDVTSHSIYGFMAKDNGGYSVGQFVRARTETYLKPFSAYLKYENPMSVIQRGSKRSDSNNDLPDVLEIVWVAANGTVTSAGYINTRTGEISFDDETWYTIDGRKLEGKPTSSGLYIDNKGNKIAIK